MITSADRFTRGSIRLADYDYAQNGAYFVTLCTNQREHLFGEVLEGVMRLSEFGQVVAECWDAIPNHFPHVECDAFVVMPNHLHGIIVIVDAPRTVKSTSNVPVGAQHAAPLQPTNRSNSRPNVAPGSLGAIVRSFKSAATKSINRLRQVKGAPVWQRNYYEHIIRNDRELDAFRDYILSNPAQWEFDRDNVPIDER
ncbi:MAG: transposase [bacterium]|nr:transposase [bacterium]